MAWIGGVIVISLVTAHASIWGVIIVAIMASSAIVGDRNVCTIYDPIVIVVRELGRRPSGVGGMT